MRKTSLLGLLFLALSTVTLLGFSKLQSSAIDRKQLRDMLTQLGYEVTDLVKDEGKEKYSVTFVKSDLNIPVGFEISPSNNYVWLTVNLADAPKEGNAKTLDLLKQNGKIQPAFFYVTESGRLMAALAVENRGITNAIMKTKAEFITDSVGKTKDVWQK